MEDLALIFFTHIPFLSLYPNFLYFLPLKKSKFYPLYSRRNLNTACYFLILRIDIFSVKIFEFDSERGSKSLTSKSGLLKFLNGKFFHNDNKVQAH